MTDLGIEYERLNVTETEPTSLGFGDLTDGHIAEEASAQPGIIEAIGESQQQKKSITEASISRRLRSTRTLVALTLAGVIAGPVAGAVAAGRSANRRVALVERTGVVPHPFKLGILLNRPAAYADHIGITDSPAGLTVSDSNPGIGVKPQKQTGFLYEWQTATVAAHTFIESGPGCQPSGINLHQGNPNFQSTRFVSLNSKQLKTIGCEDSGTFTTKPVPAQMSVRRICELENGGGMASASCLNFTLQPSVNTDGKIAADSVKLPANDYSGVKNVVETNDPVTNTIEARLTYSGTKQLKKLVLIEKLRGGKMTETYQEFLTAKN